MTRAIRGLLSTAVLASLAFGPAGCASMPPGGPVTIPALAAAPAMSGNMTADGWAAAGMLQLELDSANPGSCYALLGRATEGTQDYLYIGVYCNEFTPGAPDRVVLGLNTKTTLPICAWKVHFTPLPAPASGGQIPGDEFWRSPLNWNAGPGTIQPTAAGWPYPNSKSWSQGGGSNAWSMETRVPIIGGFANTGCWFPPAGTPFGLYLDVLNSSNAGAPGNQQFSWGPAMAGDIRTHTPDITTWWEAQF